MKSLVIRRILETCLNQNALEVWLISGRPPLLRFADNVRELVTGEPLTSDAIIKLIFDGIPNLKESYRRHGFCAFDFPCDWRDARIRVFVVRHGRETMATLTPLPPRAPEVQYSDDHTHRRL
jgi:Tfp pilus assembly pilus retraction ATPase PilT